MRSHINYHDNVIFNDLFNIKWDGNRRKISYLFKGDGNGSSSDLKGWVHGVCVGCMIFNFFLNHLIHCWSYLIGYLSGYYSQKYIRDDDKRGVMSIFAMISPGLIGGDDFERISEVGTFSPSYLTRLRNVPTLLKRSLIRYLKKIFFLNVCFILQMLAYTCFKLECFVKYSYEIISPKTINIKLFIRQKIGLLLLYSSHNRIPGKMATDK